MANDKDDYLDYGAEPLEGSGFEDEAELEEQRAETLRELQAIGSVTCLIPPEDLPAVLDAARSQRRG